jgi:hypothetical protein
MLMPRIKPITVYNLALLAVEPQQKSPGHADDGNPLQCESSDASQRELS